MNHHHHHMLRLHVLLPAAVLGVLLVAGAPLSGAIGLAMGASCLAMMGIMALAAIPAALRLRPRDEAPKEPVTT